MTKKLIVGICGASGSIYGVTLLKELLIQGIQTHVIISSDGLKVMSYELDFKENLKKFITDKFKIAPDSVTGLIQHDINNFFSPPASGSFKHSGMVIAPCSMKTMAAISAGLADNLITRSADICLKEKRPLIIVPRETPLSAIHLKNMQRVSSAGAVVLPAMPGFYSRPETIQDLVDFVVARILNQLDIEHNIMGEWGNENLV